MLKQVSQEAFTAWAAGFFDGEGCVNVSQGRLMVMVGQVDPSPLGLLQVMWGGSVGERNDGVAQWAISGTPAVEFLTAILPYLTVKERVAALGIALQDTVVGRGHRPSKQSLALRQQIMRQVSAINSPPGGKKFAKLLRRG